MSKIHAVITGIGGYVPEYKLTNHELSQMMDTNDEWITSRVGIKERRILKEPHAGTSVMATKAAEELFQKKNIHPEEIDLIICATTTPDHIFPATSAMIADNLGIKNALAFDIQAACSGFIVALTNAASFIETGRYKKVLVFGAEKMSSITNYDDRTTAPLFGDGAAVALVEPTTEELGVMDSVLLSDGVGRKHLHLKAGGSSYPASYETIDNKEHTIYQEGQNVYKYAVTNMAEASAQVMERNNLKGEDIAWLIP